MYPGFPQMPLTKSSLAIMSGQMSLTIAGKISILDISRSPGYISGKNL